MTHSALIAAASSSPRALWYLTRGAGAVALVGLTTTLVLGITDSLRVSSRGWPRFVLDALHRNVALVTLAVLVIHILTAVIDTFAPIRIVDAVVPFVSAYRPLWLGLGALAFDLLLAVAITSALRRRLGHRAWRAVHWTAYACWPLALVHELGTGTDARLGWMLALTVACVFVVLAAVGWRLAAAGSVSPGARLAAGAGIVAGGIAVAAWAAQGPLAPHWSRRAGTPVALLGATPAAAKTPIHSHAAGRSAPTLQAPFTAQVSGSVSQSQSAGQGQVALDLALSGAARGALHVRLSGPALPDGGVSMTSSSVTLGPSGGPAQYHGTISALSGPLIVARLSGPSGRAIRLRIDLQIDPGGGNAQGTVSAVPEAGGSA